MLVFLSKKLAIGSSVKVTTTSWSMDHSCIAVGADDGIVRLIPFDAACSHKGLQVKQQLTGHSSPITGCTWNDGHHKLTTSDASGLVIVWIGNEKEEWTEEMVNNRGKAFPVTGLSWSPDGSVIAILYEDGAMIIGSVDGSRLWEKEFKVLCRNVQWSPDSKILLVGVGDEVHAFDENGKLLSSINLSSASYVVCIKWCQRQSDRNRCLAVAFSDGSIQFMRHEADSSPLLCETGLKITCMDWSLEGSILAVAGRNRSDKETKSIGVSFLLQESQSIDCLQSIRLPGKEVTSLSWHKDGLSVVLGVDSFVYFAVVKRDYLWTFFESTAVYSPSGGMALHDDVNENVGYVVFWNIKSDSRYLRPIGKLLAIASCDSHCVLAAMADSATVLVMCNSKGVPVAQQEVEVKVKDVAMTSELVIAVSKNSFIVWRYLQDLNGRATSSLAEEEAETLQVFSISSSGSILCLSCSEKLLVVALTTGTCLLYKLPVVNQVESIVLKFADSPAAICPASIFLSSDGQRLAILDRSSRLLMYDMESNSLQDFEKKDVWSFQWCSDQSSYFAITEKNKMMIYKEMECEESCSATGHIARFRDFCVTSVQLDFLVNDISAGESLVTETEAKLLRDIKNILKNDGLKKAESVIDSAPHPRLWRLLTDHAMRELDFTAAEAAFVRCKDYPGIQFVKKLSKLTIDGVKKAGVCAYFGEFDEAESIYLDLDRKDLAVEMRRTMGQHEHVLRLISDGSELASDSEIRETIKLIADDYADRMQYEEAVKFYERSDDFASIFHCYMQLENYDSLTTLMTKFTPSIEELINAAETFESVGMCEEAVDAYLRAGQVKEAVRCCVTLNSWQLALTLAQQYEISDTDLLLSQYAAHLLLKEKYFDIVELYKKAGRVHDASSMILKVIEDLKRDSRIVSVRLFKQLHCLIGILHSESEERKQKRAAGQRRSTLTSLLREDESLVSAAVNFRAFDSPWKGCEAYHFYLLAHKHLYGSTSSITGSSIDDAMKCALYLRDFEEFLNPEDIYSLIALTACGNRNFVLASKAFMKLETMSEIPEQKRKQYLHLATDIFARHPPRESRNIAKHECSSCGKLIVDYVTVCPSCNSRFPTCVATGRPIVNVDEEWTCDRCHHAALKSEIIHFSSCPLCHFQNNQE